MSTAPDSLRWSDCPGLTVAEESYRDHFGTRGYAFYNAKWKTRDAHYLTRLITTVTFVRVTLNVISHSAVRSSSFIATVRFGKVNTRSHRFPSIPSHTRYLIRDTNHFQRKTLNRKNLLKMLNCINTTRLQTEMATPSNPVRQCRLFPAENIRVQRVNNETDSTNPVAKRGSRLLCSPEDSPDAEKKGGKEKGRTTGT